MPTRKQELLIQVRAKYCDGKTTQLAQAIGKDYSYVHRLFYPEDKTGHKGIGPEIMEACTRAFGLPPGFWEGAHTDLPSPMQNRVPVAPREPPIHSPYARLLANTFDALAMDPATAKQAFVAATQVLIDHSNRGIASATAPPGHAGLTPSTLTAGQIQSSSHS